MEEGLQAEVEECTDWQDTGGAGDRLGVSFSLCRTLRRGELGVILGTGCLLGENLQGERMRLSPVECMGVKRRLGVGLLGTGEAEVTLGVRRLLEENLQGDRFRLSPVECVGVKRRLGVQLLTTGEAEGTVAPSNEDSEGLETAEDDSDEAVSE